MSGLAQRLLNALIGEDEAANALLGGSPQETISGTVGRGAAKNIWWAKWILQPLVNLVMRDPKHCQQAYAAEQARRQALDPQTLTCSHCEHVQPPDGRRDEGRPA